MKVKTFTALITVAVDDDEELPHEFTISDYINNVMEGKKPTNYMPVQACFASAVPGDGMYESEMLLADCKGLTLRELFDAGCRIDTIKSKHARLRERASGEFHIQHPSSGSLDIDG